MFAVDDHLGAIVSDGEGKLAMATWGSRKWTHIDLNKDRLVPLPNFTPLKFIRNPSHFVDYQDAKYLGTVAGIGNGPLAICGGLNQYDNLRLGGIAIMDIETAVPIMEIPVPLITEHGFSLCQNPIDVDVVDGKLRFYFMPDQNQDTTMLLLYEASSVG